MPYADDENSAHDGEPRELYEFIGPNTTYRYTSGTIAVTYLTNTYALVEGLRRSSVGSGSTDDPVALEVSIACSAQVVEDYGFTTPPRSLRLKVYRQQVNSAEFQTIWDGVVVAISAKGRMARIRSASQMGDRLSNTVPSVSIQRTCNHFLYDSHCTINAATYDLAVTVSVIDGAELTVNTIGGASDSWYRAGKIVRDSDGESRTIVAQVGTLLTLHSAFGVLAVGNAMTLYAGCDHTVQTCNEKFNNTVNFGGHPMIPQSNPFLVGLRLKRDLT